MLFTEQDLNYVNALNLLEEATYLSEDESIINPATIPVKEVSRLGYGVVRFDDVDKLSEDYGIDYIDAMYAIAEASDMDPEYLAVSVPEEDIIVYPEIVNELANIVIQPLSESDIEYQFVTECVEAWLESGDEGYLDYILTEASDQDYRNLGLDPTVAREFDQRVAKNSGGYKAGQDLAASGAHRMLNLGKQRLSAAKNNPSLLHQLQTGSKGGTGSVPKDVGLKQSIMADKYFNDNDDASSSSNSSSSNSSSSNSSSRVNLKRDRGARHFYSAYQNGGDSFGRLGRDVKEIWKSDGNLKGKVGALGYAIGRNKKTAMKIGAGMAAGAALAGGIYAYKQYKNKPKSVIGKRIAALRGIYKKFMMNAQKNPQKAGMFKRIAAKILSVIDKLMGYLQNAAG